MSLHTRPERSKVAGLYLSEAIKHYRSLGHPTDEAFARVVQWQYYEMFTVGDFVHAENEFASRAQPRGFVYLLGDIAPALLAPNMRIDESKLKGHAQIDVWAKEHIHMDEIMVMDFFATIRKGHIGIWDKHIPVWFRKDGALFGIANIGANNGNLYCYTRLLNLGSIRQMLNTKAMRTP